MTFKDTPAGIIAFWTFVVAMCLVTALMTKHSEDTSRRPVAAVSAPAPETLRCNVGYLEVWVSNTYVISARCHVVAGAGYGQVQIHQMLIPRPGRHDADDQVGAYVINEVVTSVPEWAR